MRIAEEVRCAAGKHLSRKVAAIEDATYAAIDAITNEDIHGTLNPLRTFIDRPPSGEAITHRIVLND